MIVSGQGHWRLFSLVTHFKNKIQIKFEHTRAKESLTIVLWELLWFCFDGMIII